MTSSAPDRPGLDADRLRGLLCPPAGPFPRLELVQETGSTNMDLVDHAQRDPAAWPDLSVLSAELQTAGRGRLDREWIAPARSSLFVSVLLRPVNAAGLPLPVQSYSWLSLLAALSLAESLDGPASLEARIKWPNDVMIQGRKVSGILAHLVPGTDGPPAVVVGTGINVSLTPVELPVPTATSLLLAGAATTDRTELLEAYLRQFAANYRRFCAADGDAAALQGPPDGTAAARASLAQRVTAAMLTIGQQVRATLPNGATLEGLAVELADDGALRLQDGFGRLHTVAAADVERLRPLDS